MTVTHRTLTGGWALCANGATCKLLFHFPDVTPAEMAAVPERILWELCALVDSPTSDDSFGVRWLNAEGQMHRDYDLPACFSVHGVHYYMHGEQQRAEGPASIYDDGLQLWYQDGALHRAGGLPAVVNPSGTARRVANRPPVRDDGRRLGHTVSVAEAAEMYWVDGVEDVSRRVLLPEVPDTRFARRRSR